jgi:Ser/Thr protein kinase RdoA (MazF antagonist)
VLSSVHLLPMGLSMSREKNEPDGLRPLAERFASQWGSSAPEFIRGFSNVVYRLRRDDGPLYLRITPATHRSLQQILSELDIVQHLCDSGATVSAPCPDREGQLVREGEANGAI